MSQLTHFQKASKSVLNYLKQHYPSGYNDAINLARNENSQMNADEDTPEENTVVNFIENAKKALVSILAKSREGLKMVKEDLKDYQKKQRKAKIITACTTTGTFITVFLAYIFNEQISSLIIAGLTFIGTILTILADYKNTTLITGGTKQKLAQDLNNCVGSAERINTYLELQPELIKSDEFRNKVAEEIYNLTENSTKLFEELNL